MLVDTDGIEELEGWGHVLVVGGAEMEELLRGGRDQLSLKVVFDGKEEIGCGEIVEIAVVDNAGEEGGIAVDCIGLGVLAGVDHKSANEGFDDIGDGMAAPDNSGGCDIIGFLGFPRVLSRLDVDL